VETTWLRSNSATGMGKGGFIAHAGLGGSGGGVRAGRACRRIGAKTVAGSRSLAAVRPLYLKGISTGAFEEALAALLGHEAGGLSAATIARLKEAWSEEHARWLKRDLAARRYVYFWADGIHVQARLEDAAQCLLVIIGATPEGKKELVGLIDGVRESTQSWRELLLDLKRRGLTMGSASPRNRRSSRLSIAPSRACR
jgi:Transposase, Mutator family